MPAGADRKGYGAEDRGTIVVDSAKWSRTHSPRLAFGADASDKKLNDKIFLSFNFLSDAFIFQAGTCWEETGQNFPNHPISRPGPANDYLWEAMPNQWQSRSKQATKRDAFPNKLQIRLATRGWKTAAERGNPKQTRDAKMLKKLVLLGAVAAVGLTALFSSTGSSYVRTAISSATDSVRQNVPIEFEIERARQMIKDLKPEIAANMQVVAREEAGVEKLAQEVDAKKQQIAKAKGEIMRLKGDLESGSVRFVYNKREYSSQQVQDDLSARFKQFQVHEKTATKLSQVLSAREKNLDAARRKLDEMLSAKNQLEVEIENLKARLAMVQVAQTASPVALDDGQLSNTRQLLDDIRTRIDVAERLAASEGALEGTISLEETASPDLLNEIADYFGEGRAEVESLVNLDN